MKKTSVFTVLMLFFTTASCRNIIESYCKCTGTGIDTIQVFYSYSALPQWMHYALFFLFLVSGNYSFKDPQLSCLNVQLYVFNRVSFGIELHGGYISTAGWNAGFGLTTGVVF